MKFEILVLNRRDGIIPSEFVDVPSVMSFLIRMGRNATLFSIIARRGEKAIFIEKIINMNELNKRLTEFMVATADQY